MSSLQIWNCIDVTSEFINFILVSNLVIFPLKLIKYWFNLLFCDLENNFFLITWFFYGFIHFNLNLGLHESLEGRGRMGDSSH